MPKLNPEKLDALSKKLQEPKKNLIKVGMSTCGIAAGAGKAMEILKKEIKDRKLDIKVEQCGCAGRCYAEPLVEVAVEGMPTVTYGKVDTETARDIVEKHICGKRLLNDHIFNAKRD